MNRVHVSWKIILITLATVTLALPGLAAGDDLLKPTNKAESWRLEQHEQGKATLSVDGDAIVVDVTNVDDASWHVQIFQTKLDLKNGKEYVLTFKAKAAESRELQAQAAIDQEDWHNAGLDETVQVSKDWKEYKYTFTANDTVEKNNRVGFVLGQAKGKVWIKDVVLKEAKK